MSEHREHWKVCSTCRKPLGFTESYYACDVSTCNRKRTAFYFCSVMCWDAHVPMMRHRDAGAIEKRAPTRAEWEAAEAKQRDRAAPKVRAPNRPSAPNRVAGEGRVVAPAGAPESITHSAPVTQSVPPAERPADDGPPRATLDDLDDASALEGDILIVASRLKKYIKLRGGLRTSDDVLPGLSDIVRAACDEAILSARDAERLTVLDRDVPEWPED